MRRNRGQLRSWNDSRSAGVPPVCAAGADFLTGGTPVLLDLEKLEFSMARRRKNFIE
jgi:hypothetical protein